MKSAGQLAIFDGPSGEQYHQKEYLEITRLQLVGMRSSKWIKLSSRPFMLMSIDCTKMYSLQNMSSVHYVW